MSGRNVLASLNTPKISRKQSVGEPGSRQYLETILVQLIQVDENDKSRVTKKANLKILISSIFFPTQIKRKLLSKVAEA